MKQKRRRSRTRRLAAALAMMFGLMMIAVWLINSQEVLDYALGIINTKGVWQIEVGDFSWQPLTSSVRLKKVVARHRPDGKLISLDGALLRYRLLGFIRGKLVLGKLELDGLDIELPAGTRPRTKKRKGLDIAKLILLKNVELREGLISQLSVGFGEKLKLGADEVRMSMSSGLLGENRLSARTDGLVLAKARRQIVSAGVITLDASTNLDRWNAEFPYMNSFRGKAGAQDAKIEGIVADRIDAPIRLEDDSILLDGLSITIRGRTLAGKLSLNTRSEEFDLSIDIDEPISIPYFGKPSMTVDTAGKLSGHIRLAGTGLSPSKSAGRGKIDVTHAFDASPEAPVSVRSDVTWEGGAIRLEGAKARAGEDEFSIGGTVDIPGRKIMLTAKGERFPIEHVFDKFKNPHLKKIFGPSDFAASFEGWKKDFVASVSGTTYGGGWIPIEAERIKTELTATYDQLVLKGFLFDGERQTGSADLAIKFGPKAEGLLRDKWIELKASLSDHKLDRALAAYGIEGNGNGEIGLSGHYLSFKGLAKAAITSGTWHGLRFGDAAATIDISRQRIVFKDLRISASGPDSTQVPGELTADLSPGILRLAGKPAEGLTIDGTYRYEDGRWRIDKLSWDDPLHKGRGLQISGAIASDGPIDLKIKGNPDIRIAKMIPSLVMEGAGPAEIDIAVRGSTKDPRADGSIVFGGDMLALRPAQTTLNNLEGSIRFEGSRIRFDDLAAEIEDGKIAITGHLDHRNLAPRYADIALSGDAMRYRSREGDFSVELEGELKLIGEFPSPVVSGDITIIDGRYTKDFKLVDAMTKRRELPPKLVKGPTWEFNPRLDLRMSSTGDMEIRNNVGDIWLNVNVEVKGSREKPAVAGAIDVLYGKVHYLGMNFDITRGFVEFRERYSFPYIEIYAQKEINVYNANLVLHGHTNNLALDLSATSPSGPLEKRDVVSLILFGMTEQERIEMAEHRGDQFTASMVTRSVSGVLERPVTKYTHLDVFRLEAAEPESGEISRVYIGKRLSDRLSLNFSTDINAEDAIQTVVTEYLLTDNFIFKGSRSTDGRYELSGGLRFKLR